MEHRLERSYWLLITYPANSVTHGVQPDASALVAQRNGPVVRQFEASRGLPEFRNVASGHLIQRQGAGQPVRSKQGLAV
jgi:hypothetical protein